MHSNPEPGPYKSERFFVHIMQTERMVSFRSLFAIMCIICWASHIHRGQIQLHSLQINPMSFTFVLSLAHRTHNRRHTIDFSLSFVAQILQYFFPCFSRTKQICCALYSVLSSCWQLAIRIESVGPFSCLVRCETIWKAFSTIYGFSQILRQPTANCCANQYRTAWRDLKKIQPIPKKKPYKCFCRV